MKQDNAKKQSPSDKAKLFSARVMAVQALYQALQTKQSATSVIKEYLEHRTEIETEGEKLEKPDGVLFEKILNGVHERHEDLEGMIRANSKKVKREKEIEPLLKAILLCGIYELSYHQDIDSPIIINDYLNVTHGFYEKGEVSFINAVLDAVSKLVRA